MDSELLERILDTELVLSTYITDDNEPGAILAHKDLKEISTDKNKMTKMNQNDHKIIKIRDILQKGFINVGSLDEMETLKITYPIPNTINKESDKPIIKGTYMHGSRKQYISDPTGIDFLNDPESDNELYELDYFD